MGLLAAMLLLPLFALGGLVQIIADIMEDIKHGKAH